MNAHKLSISQKTIDDFCNYLAKNMGISVGNESRKRVETKIASIIHSFEMDADPETCLIQIMESPVQEELLSQLAQFLSVGETYFFRDANFFTVLENEILPELINRKKNNRKIRIWSSGCATGEEPYSIAILLYRLIRDIEKWDIVLLGSDINTKFLQKAKKGIYKKWSFRSTPPKIKSDFFTFLKNDHFAINPEIQQLVTFSYVNLIDASYPKEIRNMGGFDLILCNNVLIYFTPENIIHTVRQLSNLLREGGLLCVTSIEVPYIQDPHLIPCRYGNTVLFKKSSTSNRENSLPALDETSLETQVIYDHALNRDFHFNPEETQTQTEIFNVPVQVATTEKTNTQNSHTDNFFAEIETLLQAGHDSRAFEKIEEFLENRQEEKANSICKKYLHYLTLPIWFHANQKNLEKALELCHRYVKIDPLDPGIYRLRAQILQGMNRLNEAVDSLRNALFLDSELVIAHFELGCLFNQLKRFKDSERCFRNAVKLLDTYPIDAEVPGTEGVLAGNLKKIIMNKGI